jgi:phosphoglycolate phosphatase
MKKIALFDFDGVIVDTFEMAFQIMKVDDDFSRDEFRQLFAGNIYDSLDVAATKRNFPTDEEYYAKYSPTILKIKPFSGIPELFKQLHERQVLIFIVSSTANEPILDYLQEFKLDRYVADILGGDIERSKVKKFQMIFKQTGIEFADMVFVTDTVGDIIEANRVGIESIAVTYGYHDEAFLKSAPGKVSLVHTADQISPIILGK